MPNITLVFKYAFKDLMRHKTRTFVGVLGITVSISLLALILFLSDSVSVTFVDYLSIDAGQQDFNIQVRHYNGEPENRSDYYDYQGIIDKVQGEVKEIENFIPRMNVWGNVNLSKGYDTPELINQRRSVLISGLDFELENQLDFGSFLKPGTNDILEITSLPMNHCAIYYGLNEEIKYAENDTIEIRMGFWHGNHYYYGVRNFTVDRIFDFQLKWPIVFASRPLIVVDINTLYDTFGNGTFYGKCNELILTLNKNQNIYDARDIQGSENRAKKIAGEVQLLIGLKEYTIDSPKVDILGFSEWFSVGLTIIFVFVSIISMLISGVLINGILKTSVEERIREFGIFRTLGATKKYNLVVVLTQGLLLCNFGTILGIFLAQLFTGYVVLPIAGALVARTIPGLAGHITFSSSIWSIVISYMIGLSVGIVVSISPALKVMKLQLIESIHPYRKEDVLYKLQKRASVNYKLLLVGAILTVNAAFVLFVLPRILNSGDTALFSGTLIALLMIFLIGMTLAGLAILPLIVRIFIRFFQIFTKKLAPVYRIFIFRYARRNSSTIITFAFTFSFVIFTATVFSYLGNNGVVSAYLNYGADLVIKTDGWYEPEEEESFGLFGGGGGFLSVPTNLPKSSQENGFLVNPNRILTSDFKEELLKIDGIERISTVIASPYHLTQIYSEEGKEFTATIGDLAGIATLEVSLIGIDDVYPSTIKVEYMEFTQGDISSFEPLFEEQEIPRCIISEAISLSLDMYLGDLIQMEINRGDESQIYQFRIAGVAAAMPGFMGTFARSVATANMGGVMISQDVYMNIMNIPPIPYLDKIFIQLNKNSLRNSNDILNQIEDENEASFDFDITNLRTEVSQTQLFFTLIDVFFTITLDATIIICLFGLLSSSYSTIIERKKEVGIIRTLGLKGKEIGRLFTIESLIIMLSSGTVGVLVGWGTSLLLSVSINLTSGLPNIPVFPLTDMILVFSISIIFTLLGMKVLLNKSRKKKIIDIYRETM
ncbi:MAG: FtsX-like permease family protein [Candidatus Lokiarchaeota archaeon]|nr:FtsX-like permease family protein [Candidatus Lokiarchaeota archaeon]